MYYNSHESTIYWNLHCFRMNHIQPSNMYFLLLLFLKSSWRMCHSPPMQCNLFVALYFYWTSSQGFSPRGTDLRIQPLCVPAYHNQTGKVRRTINLLSFLLKELSELPGKQCQGLNITTVAGASIIAIISLNSRLKSNFLHPLFSIFLLIQSVHL